MTRPVWDPKTPVVPLSTDGSLLHYPDTWRGLHWAAWEPFTAALSFEGFQRGRSSAIAIFKHDDGRHFPMFLADLEDYLIGHALTHQRTDVMTWTVRKRGQNYGIGRMAR